MRDIEYFLSFVNVRFQFSDMHVSFRIPKKVRKLLRSYGLGTFRGLEREGGGIKC